MVLTTSVSGAVAAGSVSALAAAWYKDDRSGFRFFNDLNEWQQLDKAGHAATTWTVSLIVSDAYKWAGVSRKRAILYGAVTSFAYMSVIEVMDGFSKGYGFSISDVGANALGSAAAFFDPQVKTSCYPIPKFSYHFTEYAALNPALLGSNRAERVLKDYNGHTYWLSVPSIIRRYPWACISFGYGATGMANAKDVQNQIRGLDPYRSYYFSLDADLTKIPLRNCALKGLTSVFRFVKIPFPALEINRHKAVFHPFYF